MKKIYALLSALLLTIAATAQTLKVTEGNVTYLFPAAQAGEMSFTDGTTLTIMNKTFTLSNVSMAIDNTTVKDNLVTVEYNGTSATVTVAGNVAQYVTPTVSGAYVSVAQSNTDYVDDDEITYQLSGTSTDGQFALSGSFKCTVSLAGVNLTCATGAPINITNSKRIQLSAKKNTTNTLTDCANGSQKACVYSKGQLQLQGNGTLNVIGNTKHAIKSGDYITVKNLTLNITSAVGDGISCEEYFQMKSGTVNISGVGDDGIQCDLGGTVSTGEIVADEAAGIEAHDDEDSGNVYLEGGTLNITVTADAAKGIKCEGDMRVSGGTIVINTSGGGVWDSDKVKTKSSSCLGADGNMTISGGSLNLTSTGNGGKGINADGTFTATGGTTTITTSGNAVVASSTGVLSVATSSQQLDGYDSDYKSSPKGIKVDGAILISDDAIINVTTSGTGGEGIESKTSIDITGGQTYVYASDDGINASYNTDTNGSGNLTITGGYIYAQSTGNDGMDANGNVYIRGGIVYAIGTTSPEKSIDANTEEGKKLYISGGTVIAVGDLESGASITNGTCKYTSSWNANNWYALYNGGNLVAAFYTPTKSSSSGGGGNFPGGGQQGGSQKLIVYTSSTPTLYSGSTITGGTTCCNEKLKIGATVSSGTSITLSNYSSGGGRW